MKKRWLIGLFCLAPLAVQAVAQPMEEWVRRYNGPDNGPDTALALAVDELGNVYVTGESYVSDTDSDYATVKYDADGNPLWVSRYNSPGNTLDEAQALAVDSAGNVYVTGVSSGSGTYSGGWPNWRYSTTTDYTTIKYDADGNPLWVRRYNGPSNGSDWARALAVDGLSNVYVTGTSVGSGTDSDYATIKYDADGNELWVRRYNGPGNGGDLAKALAVDELGNVYVTGDTDMILKDYATVKYNADGNPHWVSLYDDPLSDNDVPGALAVDSAGNVYVTGWGWLSGNSIGYVTVKYDGTTGAERWVSHYDGPDSSAEYDYNEAHDLAVDDNGDVYVTGVSHGSGIAYEDYEYDYATIKYDGATGAELWVSRYNSPGNGSDSASALAVDGLGNVYVTGTSVGSGTDSDYATIKYDADGNELWVRRYHGPGNGGDLAKALAVDELGNVYVIGTSVGSGTDSDYATIKYSQNLTVSIDIKPGDKRNVINPRAKGDLWVAVLSNDEFDSLQVNMPTLQFGPQGAQALHHRIKDVNHNDFEDRLLRFKIPATAIARGDTEATLTGAYGARTVEVSTVTAFRNAVAGALAGDLIVVKPGTYRFDSRVYMRRSGTSAAPIMVQGQPGAVFQSNTIEMFTITASDWHFKGLTVEGVCSLHANCEHAFHLVTGANRTRIQNSVLRDFNAVIKSGGANGVHPNDVIISDNHIYNRSARNTNSAATPIDVVGGARWIIRNNTVADFAKNGGNYISYGAFLKGESSYGLIEGNLVICSRDVPNSAGTYRIGLSLGGGGTGNAYCAGGYCDYEHANGVIHNNIVMNCSDAGIYLNKAKASKIYHNTLYATTGIEVRYTLSTATITNNIATRIVNRDGGTHVPRTNLIATNTQIQGIFMSPDVGDYRLRSGTLIQSKGSDLRSYVPKDICEQSRDSIPDLGAIEFISGTVCPANVLDAYR